MRSQERLALARRSCTPRRELPSGFSRSGAQLANLTLQFENFLLLLFHRVDQRHNYRSVRQTENATAVHPNGFRDEFPHVLCGEPYIVVASLIESGLSGESIKDRLETDHISQPGRKS